MYKRLTIAYSTLCREITPLRMRFEDDEYLGRTQQKPTMLDMFKGLEPAFVDFCKFYFNRDTEAHH